jgi:hypothetical protein
MPKVYCELLSKSEMQKKAHVLYIEKITVLNKTWAEKQNALKIKANVNEMMDEWK